MSDSTLWNGPPATIATRTAGALLIGISILEIVVMAHHPSVHTPNAEQAIIQLRALGPLSGRVHGLLIAAMLIVFLSLTEFSRRRGLGRALVRAGLTTYALGAVAMTGAALISGFIIPQIAVAAPATMGATQVLITAQLLTFGMLFNQALAGLGAAAMSVGITGWSFDLLRSGTFERVVGVAGLLIGPWCAAALLFGGFKLDVPGMMLVTVLQALWLVGSGTLLLMRGQTGGINAERKPGVSSY